MQVPQRMLIGSMKGEKILLLSSLVKWYLEHGLVVSRIYQVIQFKPVACFDKFGHSVSDTRRAGDKNSASSAGGEENDGQGVTLLAETAKLIGNSVYGKMITNQERHRDIKYADSNRKASNYIKGERYIDMEEIEHDFYEMTLEKVKVIYLRWLNTWY